MTVTLPFIEQSDLVSYYEYFKRGNPTSGHLSADAAGGILRLSGLPDPVLAKIWWVDDVHLFADFPLSLMSSAGPSQPSQTATP